MIMTILRIENAVRYLTEICSPPELGKRYSVVIDGNKHRISVVDQEGNHVRFTRFALKDCTNVQARQAIQTINRMIRQRQERFNHIIENAF